MCLKDLCFLSGAQTEEAGGKLREQLGADGVQARDGGGLRTAAMGEGQMAGFRVCFK